MTFPSVPASFNELVEPRRTALVVWDMQNGIGARAHEADRVIGKIQAVLDAARAADVLVVWSQHVAPPLELTPASGLRTLMRRQNVGDPAQLKPYMQAGSPEVQIISTLVPGPSEPVIQKSTPSFFVGTPFEIRLRARNVGTIVMTGVATEQGIEMTARHALTLGFSPVIAEDAVGSFSPSGHELGLTSLRSMADVVQTKDIIAAWRG